MGLNAIIQGEGFCEKAYIGLKVHRVWRTQMRSS